MARLRRERDDARDRLTLAQTKRKQDGLRHGEFLESQRRLYLQVVALKEQLKAPAGLELGDHVSKLLDRIIDEKLKFLSDLDETYKKLEQWGNSLDESFWGDHARRLQQRREDLEKKGKEDAAANEARAERLRVAEEELDFKVVQHMNAMAQLDRVKKEAEEQVREAQGVVERLERKAVELNKETHDKAAKLRNAEHIQEDLVYVRSLLSEIAAKAAAASDGPPGTPGSIRHQADALVASIAELRKENDGLMGVNADLHRRLASQAVAPLTPASGEKRGSISVSSAQLVAAAFPPVTPDHKAHQDPPKTPASSAARVRKLSFVSIVGKAVAAAKTMDEAKKVIGDGIAALSAKIANGTVDLPAVEALGAVVQATEAELPNGDFKDINARLRQVIETLPENIRRSVDEAYGSDG